MGMGMGIFIFCFVLSDLDSTYSAYSAEHGIDERGVV